MSNNTVKWRGLSGNVYTYEVYSKHTVFRSIDGNYIFARQTFSGWDAVYIGEGDLATRTQDPVHKKCAENKGFTHYHVHVNPSEINRKTEERDMIAGNPECLEKNGGCNKTEDG